MAKRRLGKVEDRLTAKQRRFVEEYLVDLCGAKAAVRAGYSARTADRIASRLLRKPQVAAMLAQHAASVTAELNLTVERIEKELARVAFVDPRKLRGDGGRVLELHELDEDTARAVASVKVRVAKVVRGKGAPELAESLGIQTSGDRKVEEVTLGTVETKFHSKVEALALGLKRLGALVERHSVEVEDGSEPTDEELEALAIFCHQRESLALAGKSKAETKKGERT